MTSVGRSSNPSYLARGGERVGDERRDDGGERSDDAREDEVGRPVPQPVLVGRGGGALGDETPHVHGGAASSRTSRRAEGPKESSSAARTLFLVTLAVS